MPQTVTDISALQSYIGGVMDRAEHHAGKVAGIALAIAGAIIWRKDADPIEVMVHNGDTKNVLWVKVGGKRYALSYNHKAQTIEVRQSTTQGAILRSFSDMTPIKDVVDFFRAL